MANIRVALRGLRALAALLYNVGPFDVAAFALVTIVLRCDGITRELHPSAARHARRPDGRAGSQHLIRHD